MSADTHAWDCLRAVRIPPQWLVLSSGELERFMSKIAPPLPSGCMEWMAASTASPGGGRYGRFHVQRDGRDVTLRSHRVAYTIARGVFAGALEIDHVCHNTLCQNPDHLRAVTAGENQQHRSGANRGSLSGVRGVTRADGQWRAQLQIEGRTLTFGSFETIAEAERAAISGRLEVFTHSDPELRRTDGGQPATAIAGQGALFQ